MAYKTHGYATRSECLKQTGWPWTAGLCDRKTWKKLIKKAEYNERSLTVNKGQG